MRFAVFVACLLTGFDAASRAVGVSPQGLFDPQMIWIWWVCAGCWVFIGITALWKGIP